MTRLLAPREDFRRRRNRDRAAAHPETIGKVLPTGGRLVRAGRATRIGASSVNVSITINTAPARRFATIRLRPARLLVRMHAVLFLFGTRHHDRLGPQARNGRMPDRTEREKKNARPASMRGRGNRKLSKDAPQSPHQDGGTPCRVGIACEQAKVRPQEGAEIGRVPFQED